MATNSVARAVSNIIGWIYFACWSLSFYPQPLLNIRRRSTAGFSIDFQATNVLGFLCYTIYNGLFLFSPAIRAQYAARHPTTPLPTVRGNDFAFALHGLVVCVVIYTQFYPRLWGFTRETPPARISVYSKTGCAAGVCWIACVAGWVLVRGNGGGTDARTWAWIDVVYAFSYVKLLVSLIKYTPQIWTNYTRQSTVGWSIVTVWLDFAGGVLSITQLVIDASLQGDWRAISGNFAKVALALFSIVMDLIFMTQHYFLYRRARIGETQGAHEQDPLLGAAGAREDRSE